MKKGLNILKSIMITWSKRHYRIMGLLWIFASFMYIGEPQFWIVLGFGTVFNGMQDIIEK